VKTIISRSMLRVSVMPMGRLSVLSTPVWEKKTLLFILTMSIIRPIFHIDTLIVESS
jgi:hypothetical protein